MSLPDRLVLLPDPSPKTGVLHLIEEKYTLRVLVTTVTKEDGVVVTAVTEDLHPVTTIVCYDSTNYALPRDPKYKQFTLEFFDLNPPRNATAPVRIDFPVMRAWLPKFFLLNLTDPMYVKDPPVITMNISDAGDVDFFDDFLSSYEKIEYNRESMEGFAEDSDLWDFCYGGTGEE